MCACVGGEGMEAGGWGYPEEGKTGYFYRQGWINVCTSYIARILSHREVNFNWAGSETEPERILSRCEIWLR